MSENPSHAQIVRMSKNFKKVCFLFVVFFILFDLRHQCVSYQQFVLLSSVCLSVVYCGGADPLAAPPTYPRTFRNNAEEMLFIFFFLNVIFTKNKYFYGRVKYYYFFLHLL